MHTHCGPIMTTSAGFCCIADTAYLMLSLRTTLRRASDLSLPTRFRCSLLFSIKQQVAVQYSRRGAHSTPQSIYTMASKTSPILFLSFVSSIYALTINTPASVVECQPLQLSWSNGSAPYYLAVIPGVSRFQLLVSPISKFQL